MAPALTIRDARPEDDEAVGELLVTAFVDTYARKMPEVVVTDRRKQELRAVAAKRQVAKVWVAHLDHELAGTVAVWPPGSPGSTAWLPNAAVLRHLAVAPQLQGRGVSTALLDEAEAWAFSQRFDAICLHVRRGVTGVADLYARRGYVRDPTGDDGSLPDVFLEAWALRTSAHSQGRQRSSL